jgi:20S proteasome alpha/beta subunit
MVCVHRFVSKEAGCGAHGLIADCRFFQQLLRHACHWYMKNIKNIDTLLMHLVVAVAVLAGTLLMWVGA